MREVPALNRIQNEYGDQGVEVVAINVAPQIPLESWQQYLQKLGLSNSIVAQDTSYEAIKASQVRTAGATVVLNKKGEVVFQDRSATSYEELKLAVETGL